MLGQATPYQGLRSMALAVRLVRLAVLPQRKSPILSIVALSATWQVFKVVLLRLMIMTLLLETRLSTKLS